jgi:hypothetical protein
MFGMCHLFLIMQRDAVGKAVCFMRFDAAEEAWCCAARSNPISKLRFKLYYGREIFQLERVAYDRQAIRRRILEGH